VGRTAGHHSRHQPPRPDRLDHLRRPPRWITRPGMPRGRNAGEACSPKSVLQVVDSAPGAEWPAAYRTATYSTGPFSSLMPPRDGDGSIVASGSYAGSTAPS
jgi:hypothetical protein